MKELTQKWARTLDDMESTAERSRATRPLTDTPMMSHRAGRRSSAHRSAFPSCECGNVGSAEFVSVTLEEYASAHETQRRFLVLPGHEIPELERVVEQRDRFTVVQKPWDAARVVEDERA